MESTILVLGDAVVASLALAKALEARLGDVYVLRARSWYEAGILAEHYAIDLVVVDGTLSDGDEVELDELIADRCPKPTAYLLREQWEQPSRVPSGGAQDGVRVLLKPIDASLVASIIYREWWLPRTGTSDTSFSASLRHLIPWDVVQLKLHNRETTVLEFIPSNRYWGRLFIEEGQLVHAEVHYAEDAIPMEGMAALRDVLHWKTGRVLEVPLTNPRRSLEGSWQDLVISVLSSPAQGGAVGAEESQSLECVAC